MTQFAWIIPLVLVSGSVAYMTATPENTRHFIIPVIILLALPIWSYVAYFSKNTLRDALIYDIVITLTYSGIIALLTHKSYTMTQVYGLVICLSGLIVFKTGGGR